MVTGEIYFGILPEEKQILDAFHCLDENNNHNQVVQVPVEASRIPPKIDPITWATDEGARASLPPSPFSLARPHPYPRLGHVGMFDCFTHATRHNTELIMTNTLVHAYMYEGDCSELGEMGWSVEEFENSEGFASFMRELKEWTTRIRAHGTPDAPVRTAPRHPMQPSEKGYHGAMVAWSGMYPEGFSEDGERLTDYFNRPSWPSVPKKNLPPSEEAVRKTHVMDESVIVYKLYPTRNHSTRVTVVFSTLKATVGPRQALRAKTRINCE